MRLAFPASLLLPVRGERPLPLFRSLRLPQRSDPHGPRTGHPAGRRCRPDHARTLRSLELTDEITTELTVLVGIDRVSQP
ncbi:hypothetical protein SSP24_83110 [Streptomyces spinoverrucosus]|uniref:Uncharacterized protein n=1 Tax=Streptomyces spinoverrucosus TaxID=284043 RepID=A0A4Y3W041_9ACTN|nr:hypothetical protein SSP24_83110 [Streptomyces spinoverrucosus]GHB99243.1 hypothetical protein GCM10010397_84390 [Streptomyces spinoverrucosus]